MIIGESTKAFKARVARKPRDMPQDFNPKFCKDGDYITYDDGHVRLGVKFCGIPEVDVKVVEALRIAVWRKMEEYRIMTSLN